MQLAQVEGFLETARRASVTRAAAALFLTQPALTARLRSLELEIGRPLFRRGRRGMTLTEAGLAFLPYAERALSALRDGTAAAGTLTATEELAIGAAPAISTYVLPRLLVRFEAERPGLRLVVRTGHSEEIAEMVARGDVDVGLIRELHHPELERRPLYDDELVLVVDPAHPLARIRRARVARLRDARLILFDRTSSYYELTRGLFRQVGAQPRGVLELDNIDAAKQMVLAGLGVALLPTTSVARELRSGALRRVALVDVPSIERRVVAVRRRSSGDAATGPRPAATAFWAALDRVDEVLSRVSGADPRG